MENDARTTLREARQLSLGDSDSESDIDNNTEVLSRSIAIQVGKCASRKPVFTKQAGQLATEVDSNSDNTSESEDTKKPLAKQAGQVPGRSGARIAGKAAPGKKPEAKKATKQGWSTEVEVDFDKKSDKIKQARQVPWKAVFATKLARQLAPRSPAGTDSESDSDGNSDNSSESEETEKPIVAKQSRQVPRKAVFATKQARQLAPRSAAELTGTDSESDSDSNSDNSSESEETEKPIVAKQSRQVPRKAVFATKQARQLAPRSPAELSGTDSESDSDGNSDNSSESETKKPIVAKQARQVPGRSGARQAGKPAPGKKPEAKKAKKRGRATEVDIDKKSDKTKRARK